MINYLEPEISDKAQKAFDKLIKYHNEHPEKFKTYPCNSVNGVFKLLGQKPPARLHASAEKVIEILARKLELLPQTDDFFPKRGRGQQKKSDYRKVECWASIELEKAKGAKTIEQALRQIHGHRKTDYEIESLRVQFQRIKNNKFVKMYAADLADCATRKEKIKLLTDILESLKPDEFDAMLDEK